MAPVRMKTRSDVTVKESLAFKPKHPPVVSKRKADGSPLKPATTMQIKRHLVDNSKENNILIKTKNQLLSIATAKKPLGVRNMNSHTAILPKTAHITKDVKTATTKTICLKKDSLSVVSKKDSKSDCKENIVASMTLTKVTETKLIGAKLIANATSKTKDVKVSDKKTTEIKSTAVKTLSLRDTNTGLPKPLDPKPKIKTEIDIPAARRISASQIPVNVKIKPKKSEVVVPVRTTGPVTRQSLSRKSSDNESTLYESALEDVFHDRLVLVNSLNETNESKKLLAKPTLKQLKALRKPPPGVENFDLASQDLFSVGKYAFEIFEYLKSRESYFKISNYMAKQRSITKNMRAILVDWLVEIQESFELNHETLYLAVKVIDLYLSKVVISKEHLQLLGCTAMLIACKYDERIAPLLDDFIDVSDRQFSAKDVTTMEGKVLKTIDYDLGSPLSYRFLRRYSRCAKFGMPMLTLARYILELSLMDFNMALESESKLAAAALYLAIRMKKESTWTPTLEYYSGYKEEDLKDLVVHLNTMLHQKPKDKPSTIRKKYSHSIFHSVAHIPLLDQIDFSIQET